jgi:hypothetical protein
VIRSVLAHNLTSRFANDGNNFETLIRRIVHNRDISAGDEMHFYVLPYAGDQVYLMHDFTAMYSGGASPLGSVISFPPITILLTLGQMRGYRGANVTEHLQTPRDRIVIDMRMDPTGLWPGSAGFVMGGARFAEHIVAEDD